jgi:hypothetical protein
MAIRVTSPAQAANGWSPTLVADTYPRGERREQVLYLYHLPTGRFVLPGRVAMVGVLEGVLAIVE